MDDLFQQAVKLFLKVNIAQFRRNFLHVHALQVKRSKALRQRVMTLVKAKEKTFNIKFLLEDTSVGKEASHHRLRSEMLNMDRFEQIFTKAQIIQIAQAYGLKFNSSIKRQHAAHSVKSYRKQKLCHTPKSLKNQLEMEAVNRLQQILHQHPQEGQLAQL